MTTHPTPTRITMLSLILFTLGYFIVNLLFTAVVLYYSFTKDKKDK